MDMVTSANGDVDIDFEKENYFIYLTIYQK